MELDDISNTWNKYSQIVRDKENCYSGHNSAESSDMSNAAVPNGMTYEGFSTGSSPSMDVLQSMSNIFSNRILQEIEFYNTHVENLLRGHISSSSSDSASPGYSKPEVQVISQDATGFSTEQQLKEIQLILQLYSLTNDIFCKLIKLGN